MSLLIASKILSVENRRRKRSDDAQRHFEHAIECLLKEDTKVTLPIPYIDLKPHPWRTLKTKGSSTFIPLTKEALWASKRLLEANNDSIFAFPRYCDKTGCKANSASGGLNKWLH